MRKFTESIDNEDENDFSGYGLYQVKSHDFFLWLKDNQ